MSETIDALNALKTRVLTIDPSPQSGLVNAWVYPTQYSAITLATLPVAIISRAVGRVDPWEIKATGLGLHRWEAEVLIPLAEGPLQYPNAASAAAEVKQDTYEKALADVLYANMTLGGTVLKMGGDSAGGGFKLFDCMINHMQWNVGTERKVYWGLRFAIQMRQEHPQVMGA